MAEPEAHRDPLAMQRFFAQYGVTTTHFVPSMLAAFIASLTPASAGKSCASLKRVFCSGEALPTALCREWETLTNAPLHNLYGPTEAAVDVSWYPACGDELAAVDGNSIPIGYPVWNTGYVFSMRICSRCRRAWLAISILPVSNWRRAIWGVRILPPAVLSPILLRQANGCTVPEMWRAGWIPAR